MPFSLELYKKNGFCLLENFLDKYESDNLMKYARKRLSSNKSNQSILEKKDTKGKVTLLSNWSTTLNNDVFSLIARDQRLVNLSKVVLGKSIA